MRTAGTGSAGGSAAAPGGDGVGGAGHPVGDPGARPDGGRRRTPRRAAARTPTPPGPGRRPAGPRAVGSRAAARRSAAGRPGSRSAGPPGPAAPAGRRRTGPPPARAPARPRRRRPSCADPSAPRRRMDHCKARSNGPSQWTDPGRGWRTSTTTGPGGRDMSIGITLALLAAVGYGTADFVGGAGARRAADHVHRLHRPGHRSGGDAAGRARLARHADPGPRRVGPARRTRQRGREHLPAAGAVAGSHGGRRPDVRRRRCRPAGRGGTRGGDRPVTLVWIGLAPRAARDLAGLAPGRGRHGALGREPRRLRRRPAGRPRVRRALRGPRPHPRVGRHPAPGPQPAHRRPPDRRRRDGAAPGVEAQPRRVGLGRHLGPARGDGQPRLRPGQPPRRPQRGRGARLALPRRHGAPGPRPAQRAARRRAAPGAGVLLHGRRA